ncbi:zinc finger protein 567 isoform X2 [Bicyclus anynana]|uniref:Zinc finger protein 567 isoform X2 n=1 Tax=Bicyclus anynana TaxID=110368 RepID=A0ABM3LY02_BICAN|nr:zinc finger protein 567 isoform X2 [Bicyclus anynana]
MARNTINKRKGFDEFSNFCRTCATMANQVRPIFDEQNQSDDLAGKINKYLPIKVSKEDGLPQVICEQCHNTLLAWDELVKCSVQASMVLQQKLSVMRLLDPDKTNEENAESTQTSLESGTETAFDISEVVRNILTNYFNELDIEEENTDFVCHMCANNSPSTSVQELTDHLRLCHGTMLQHKQSVEDFVKENITFEELLLLDKEDGEADSLCNETETKNIVLQNYCCPFCESVFSSPNRLICHLSKHFEISIANGIECCDKLYENKLSFVAHLQDVHVSKTLDQYTCKSCGKTTCDLEELQAHINEEHPESNDLNESKKAENFANLQRYIPVVCPKCKKTFSNKYNLRVHIANMHSDGKVTVYVCYKCNKVYKSQGSLKYHQKVHHEGNLSYMCAYCGEAFPTRETRDVHARIHTGAKPFKCDYCSKSYRSKNTLDRHTEMHLDIRKYTCSMCPKKFRKRSHLNYHLRTHEKCHEKINRRKCDQVLK